MFNFPPDLSKSINCNAIKLCFMNLKKILTYLWEVFFKKENLTKNVLLFKVVVTLCHHSFILCLTMTHD